MFRFLARMLGLFLIAAGFVGLVIDGTRSIANGALTFTALGEVGYRLLGDRYLLLQPAIERIHPFLWDPILLSLTLAPAAVFALVLGAILLWLGRKPVEPIGYLARR
jgi:hypothetical protein